MKISEVKCKEVVEHICENLGEELNSPKCIDIKAHIEKCGDCSHYLKSVESTISLYQKYKAELPEGAHKRLIEILGLE